MKKGLYAPLFGTRPADIRTTRSALSLQTQKKGLYAPLLPLPARFESLANLYHGSSSNGELDHKKFQCPCLYQSALISMYCFH